MKENKSHLTAITRKVLPVPTKWLLAHDWIDQTGRWKILDYGCGKAHSVNNAHFPADGYDPYYHPELPTGKYDVIICNYVLCVLSTEEERNEVLMKIRNLLNEDGIAFISVRNDMPRNGHGWTSKGTYQADVTLEIPLLYCKRQFRMYKLTRKDKL